MLFGEVISFITHLSHFEIDGGKRISQHLSQHSPSGRNFNANCGRRGGVFPASDGFSAFAGKAFKGSI
jgi:hypothetical protein